MLNVNHRRIARRERELQAIADASPYTHPNDRAIWAEYVLARRREAVWNAAWDALHAARWMMLGAALVLTSLVQTAAVGLAVAVMRPCVDDSGINCSVTAPNGTQFASVHIGNHLIIMVHNDRP